MNSSSAGGNDSGTPVGGAEANESVTERILEAASEVFAADGLHATLADVAARAGVGVATVYRRFPNKDELILALFQRRFEEALEQVRLAVEAPDPWEGFVAFFEGGVRRFSGDRGFRDFVIGSYSESVGWSRGTSPDRVEVMVHQQHVRMGEYLDRMLARCQEAGVIRDDLVASDLFALTMAAVSSIDFAAHKSGPDIYQRVIGVILDGLRPARSAPTPLPVISRG
ncbi:TetR family transcriptional regulator [Kineosporia sp. NBRC 101677]|uniref:TetR/AcrR family transcriptional regulator n=1 Tax=Kineosporia sp. NBRC 101677 TaxID=3032197 RepID=UPI0024A406E6|nr:TetR/AcrR family transcriptional regulator [Kineosporia sp. NBRC 101677]GLY15993.1 TetR family transcriptional regulator [Kineosporia sp. NBRC 101677]